MPNGVLMAWHDDTVPGRGWVELRAVTSRVRTDYTQISCDCRVRTDDATARRIVSSENHQKLQDAIRRRQQSVRITRGAVQRKDRLLVRIAAPRAPGKQGWLDFWSEQMGITVIEVYRWDVRKLDER